MNRTFKMLASRGTEIVFDDVIHAPTPRDARREMKRRLGLNSLSGIVYSSTEIPAEHIRKIVAEELAPTLKRLEAIEKSMKIPKSKSPDRALRFDPLSELP